LRAWLNSRPTFFISSRGMWKTSLKAPISSRVTTPSALAILAPRTITPMVNAMFLVASSGSSPCVLSRILSTA
jgi:hypothetical protein